MTKKQKEQVQPKNKNKPTPFWLPFGPNVFWYTLIPVILGVVVLANIYPPIKEGFFEQKLADTSKLSKNILVQEADLQTEIKSVSDLENLLQKNVSAVERVLNMIEKREKRSIEQLDGVAKTTLALDTRIQQLQAEVDAYKKQLKEKEKIQNPAFYGLSSMMVSLMDSYYRGDISSIQLATLYEKSVAQDLDESFRNALKGLIEETEGFGPVTSAELMMLSFQTLHQGAPEVEDLLSQQEATDNGYLDKARDYLSKWVEVRKLENVGNQNPWVKGLYAVQNNIVQRQYTQALKMLEQTPLKQDKRLVSLIEKLKVAEKQQQALKEVVLAYKQMNENGISQ